MTGMPASVSVATTSTMRPPPSSFTAFAPASLRKRVAVRSAWVGPSWYEPNGRSATTIDVEAPRAVARVWCSISSTVTGTVESRPSTTMPRLSPTSSSGMPASSATTALSVS